MNDRVNLNRIHCPALTNWFACMLLLLVSGICHQVAGQEVYLAGVVRDSTSYQPLAYVNVQFNTGKVVASTDNRGYFSVTLHLGDTIVFTRLGYAPHLFTVEKNEWDLNILLTETAQMLQNVTIYGNFEIHGQNQIQQSLRQGARGLNSPLQNPTAKPGNEYAVQTFGPGVTLRGPFSRFSKDEIEKRRLQQVFMEQQRTSVYREVIRSEQVKQYLTRLFAVPEADYYKKLEAFAIKYPGAENLRRREEIVDMLVAFFSEKQ